MMIFSVAILICSMVVFGTGRKLDPFNCNDGSPNGVFCTNDLTGYVECKLENTVSTVNRKTCPYGTKCACFINTSCKDARNYKRNVLKLEDVSEDVCISKNAMPVFAESFDLIYDEKKVTVNNIGQLRENIRVQVIRNAVTQQMKKRIWDSMKPEEQRFEFIVPEGHYFIKYEGTYTSEDGTVQGKCTKSKLDAFPSFWQSFEQFYKIKQEGDKETWLKVINQRNLGQFSSVETYKIGRDYQTHQPVPEYYEENYQGSVVEKRMYKLQRNYRQFITTFPGSAYFWLPAQCLSLKD